MGTYIIIIIVTTVVHSSLKGSDSNFEVIIDFKRYPSTYCLM